jgi:hypothetical protein
MLPTILLDNPATSSHDGRGPGKGFPHFHVCQLIEGVR